MEYQQKQAKDSFCYGNVIVSSNPLTKVTHCMQSQNFFDTVEETEYPTRKQRKMSRKAARKNNVIQLHKSQSKPLELQHIKPMTDNQKLVFKHFKEGKNLILHGVPGSGKSFISLYLALDEILNNPYSKYKKIIIIRSAQSGKDIGFLPGSAKQKMAEYETPYSGICANLFGDANAYQNLKNKGVIQFESTSFLRGITIEDAIVIFDEFQNATLQNAVTVLTRIGNNAKIILCGDKNQDDLTSDRFKEESGASSIMRLCSHIPSMKSVGFVVEDIVRSGFAREVIMAMIKCGI
jgi:hypothetical protein